MGKWGYGFIKAHVENEIADIYRDPKLDDKEKYSRATALNERLKDTHEETYGHRGSGVFARGNRG